MAQIQVHDLTFAYDGSAAPVFEHVSFRIDSDWRLGFVGRNGKGKTTLLRLLMGDHDYSGSITSSTVFDYFPYAVTDEDLKHTAADLAAVWKPRVQPWQILCQFDKAGMDPECLYRPFGSLSPGERTRVMLAVLFSAEDEFLLIDEPTNHLDQEARSAVKEFLLSRRGFILVSHDRDLLDAVTDHMLVLNRESVQVMNGNFTTWWENKEKQDIFAMAENEKHLKEIEKLKAAADRSSRWADKNENTKIGFDPVKEHDRNISTRAYIGAKTKAMQSRVKSFEKRMKREIEDKEGLLNDLETVPDLKIFPMTFHKETLVRANDLSLKYEGMEKPLFSGLRFEVQRGDRVLLAGDNGCGKSSIIMALIAKISESGKGVIRGWPDDPAASGLLADGILEAASGLTVSVVSQDTSWLRGTVREFCREQGYDESLLLALLRQMDLGREQFVKGMEDFSEGQKKKVLIAASLITPAHLYIWDEPLNYIDVFSRMQIEKLILNASLTMILVEHDVRFQEKVATKTVRIL